ncbi:topoisomerase DNA-binding C4 zinc finger domain-containing protein [Sphingomonas sp. Leaf62]|uniref:topoisomerase DNA-binding C4 zinc finger domain-containing protein n=1 Tax=Sphingomonas sp. Leaf62 TaxID=1736228 RepID=UPI0009ECB603
MAKLLVVPAAIIGISFADGLARGRKPTAPPSSFPPPPRLPDDPIRPLCPKCSRRMIRRTAKRGKQIRNEFWGCANYPYCRQTRPLDAAPDTLPSTRSD